MTTDGPQWLDERNRGHVTWYPWSAIASITYRDAPRPGSVDPDRGET